MPARKIGFYLDTTPAVQSLVKQALRLIEMQQVFIEIAPKPLAQAGRIGRFAHSSLLLFADNGSVATKLKQLTPSLLVKFQKRGYEITSIRVEVQPPPRQPIISCKNIVLGGQAAGHLRELAKGLPASPLRSALESLLAQASKHGNQSLEHKQRHNNQCENGEKLE
ncbi:MAG TPA: DciA family protein [Burkholderiales bacterium]|nr:DciA family protein [Burkholderiales bacterium]